MCRIPPPCVTFDAGGAPKRSVGVPPPPPPAKKADERGAHQLSWDLRDFRGWRRSEKCVVPPLFLSWIRP